MLYLSCYLYNWNFFFPVWCLIQSTRLPCLLKFNQLVSHLPGCWYLHKVTFLYISTCLLSTGFWSGRQLELHSVTIWYWDKCRDYAISNWVCEQMCTLRHMSGMGEHLHAGFIQNMHICCNKKFLYIVLHIFTSFQLSDSLRVRSG